MKETIRDIPPEQRSLETLIAYSRSWSAAKTRYMEMQALRAENELREPDLWALSDQWDAQTRRDQQSLYLRVEDIVMGAVRLRPVARRDRGLVKCSPDASA